MNTSDPTSDKFELHYRQQLSALMDGDLAPDEARFLLRRLQHDDVLNAQWERWQLLGDALRGQAVAPAPAGFAGRVSAAIAADPASASPAIAASNRSRGGLLRWGGGALAASVALVALFVARQPASDPVEPAPLAATPVVAPSVPEINLADAAQAAPTAAAAVIASRAANTVATRRSATRTRQAARSVAVVREPSPQRATGTVDAMPTPAMPVLAAEARPHDPFSGSGAETQAHLPAARPWPRSMLQGYPSGGAFTASYGGSGAARDFHPFEPHPLPDSPPIELPAEVATPN